MFYISLIPSEAGIHPSTQAQTQHQFPDMDPGFRRDERDKRTYHALPNGWLVTAPWLALPTSLANLA